MPVALARLHYVSVAALGVVLVAAAQKFDERGLHVISHASNVHVAYLADPPPEGVLALEGAGVVVHRI